MIRVDSADFSYNGKMILNSVSLKIEDEEFLGILGPNGAGKSTLLRLLCGVLKPNQGQVFLEEKPLESYSIKDVARAIAALPAETFYPYDFSVEEIVKMGRTPHLGFWTGADLRDLEIVSQSLEMVGIPHLKDRNINSLSSGERQMVFLAQAMAQEPRTLLLDEPTVHLDIHHQLQIFKLLKEWNQKRKLTVAVISHDLNIASQFCGKLLLMHERRVIVEGPPKEVITEQNLQQVYGIQTKIIDNPVTGLPTILCQ